MRQIRLLQIEFLGFVIEILAFAVMVQFCEDYVTLSFLMIMGVILILAFFLGSFPMSNMRNALVRATESIKYTKKHREETPWERISKENHFFHEKHLDEFFDTYLAEMEQLKEDDSYKQDIADYINLDTVQDAAYHSFLKEIPEVMTGLGILGTFLGLTIGLREFDNSTAETIKASIPILIDGIKVAFFTSIFGITFSLIFSLFYKFSTNRLSEVMDKFQKEFYLSVIPVQSSQAVNQLLKYQKTQTDSMELFSESLATKLADSLQKVSIPALDKVASTMDTISGEISKSQTDGMNDIVNEFINQMNKSLSGQFHELARTTRNMISWQKSMVTDMNDTLGAIRDSSINVTKVNQETDQIIGNVEVLSDKLKDYEDMLHETNLTIGTLTKQFGKVSDEQRRFMELLIEHEDTIVRKIDEIKQNPNHMVAASMELNTKRRGWFRK